MKQSKSRLLAELVQLAKDRKLFQRERVPLEIRAEAVLLYYKGLSFRQVAEHFGGMLCPQSVQNWWRRFSIVFNYPRGTHDIIVSDETNLHRGKSNLGTKIKSRARGKAQGRSLIRRIIRAAPSHVLWVAINADSMQVVNLKLGRVQTNEDCYDFLAETKQRSRTSPLILHDRGPWYVSQPPKLGLSHEHVRGGRRSRIECWNRQLKHRLDRFWRCWTPNSTTDAMETWLRSYAVIWNLTRPTPA